MKGIANLIIDVQKEFIDPNTQIGSIAKAICIPGIKKLLKITRTSTIPNFHIKTVHKSDFSTLTSFHRENQIMFCKEGSQGEEFTTVVKPLETEAIINKTKFSAFFQTDLHKQLSKLGIHTLIISGLANDCCVYISAADAAQYGYKVIFPYQTVSASTPIQYNSGVRFVVNSIGKLVNLNELSKGIFNYDQLKKCEFGQAERWFLNNYNKTKRLRRNYKRLASQDIDEAVVWFVSKMT